MTFINNKTNLNIDWSSIYNNCNLQDIAQNIDNPFEYQVLLSNIIRDYVGDGKLLEAGCGFGVTSLLVGNRCKKTLLDIEQKAIDIAQYIFEEKGHEATFLKGDIFDMPFNDQHFDVVFNAGVLEHFPFGDRRVALLEMFRVTKQGGFVIVAIPNHFSIPYRFAYKFKKRLGTWQYPDEDKIYDFSRELNDISCAACVSRETLAVKTSYAFLTRTQKIFFRIVNLFVRFEGYLTVLIYKKQ